MMIESFSKKKTIKTYPTAIPSSKHQQTNQSIFLLRIKLHKSAQMFIALNSKKKFAEVHKYAETFKSILHFKVSSAI